MRISEEFTIDASRKAKSHDSDLAQWEQLLSKTHLPWSVAFDERAPNTKPFGASVTRRWIDDLALVDCECGPCSGTRQRKQISATDDEFLVVLINRAGRETVSQEGVAVQLTPGDAVSWDSTLPARFTVWEQLSKRSLVIPRSALEEMGGNGWARSGILLRGDAPSTQLLTGYLDTLSRSLPNLSATAIAAARNATLELLIGAMRPDSDATLSSSSSSSSSGPVLRDAMYRFIGKHLLDESLSPSFIASAHGVSVRTVNRIFSASGQTVTDTVRARRLARARAELTETDRSIAAIASRWGFADGSHFSRTFKAHYGTSPTDFRAARLTDTDLGALVHAVGASVHETAVTAGETGAPTRVEQRLPLRVQDPS